MKWAKCLCRAIAFLVTSAPVSFPRTVQPVTYSYTTSNDGVYSVIFQDGVHRVHKKPEGEYSTTIHPSVLAHHYYEPNTETVYEIQRYQPLDTASSTEAPTVTITNQPRRARKKHEHVAKVSYVRGPESVSFATTISEVRTSTESPLRKVLVRTRVRPLKPTDEIPVEEKTTESLIHGQYLKQNRNFSVEQPSPLEVYQSVKINKQNDAGPVRTVVSRRRKLRNDTEHSRPNNESMSIKKNNQGPRFSSTNDQIVNIKNGEETLPIQPARDHLRMTTERTQYRGTVRGTATNTSDPPKIGTIAPRGTYRQSDNTLNYPSPFSHSEVSQVPTSTSSVLLTSSIPHRLSRKRNRQPETKVIDQFKEITTQEPIYKQQQTSRRPRTKAKNPIDSRGSSPVQHIAEGSVVKHQNETNYYTRKSPVSTAQPSSTTTEQIANEEDESGSYFNQHHESSNFGDHEPVSGPDDTEYPDEYDEDVEEEVQSENIDHPIKVLQRPLHYAYSPDSKPLISDNHKDQEKEAQGEIARKGEKSKSSHHASDGSKAAEGYDSHHGYDKSKKGHSNKDNRSKLHHEEGGQKKKHKEESGHYNENHLEAKGEKAAEFKETGKHQKGHSTKGSHNVHKKNEYLKKYEFYDEYHEDDEHKKYSGFHKGHRETDGNQHKVSHEDDDYSGGHKGKKGMWHHGNHEEQLHGHHEDAGESKRGEGEHRFGRKGGKSGDKKWKFEESVIR